MEEKGASGRIVGKQGTEATRVSLNLIYDYPVRWSKYKVLRDLFQNFYDAVGAGQWHKRFSHRLDGDMLVMKAADTGFSYDWLVHIGASTKRDSDGKYAECSDQSASWRLEYPDLLVAEAVKRKDVARLNRRRQARAWLKSCGKRYRLGRDGFSALGYKTLEQLCEEHDGFATVRSPSEEEQLRIDLLERVASVLLPELLEKTALPPCKIIESELAAWQGMTECFRLDPSRASVRVIVTRSPCPCPSSECEWARKSFSAKKTDRSLKPHRSGG